MIEEERVDVAGVCDATQVARCSSQWDAEPALALEGPAAGALPRRLPRQALDAVRAGRRPRLHARQGDGRRRHRVPRLVQPLALGRGERRERARDRRRAARRPAGRRGSTSCAPATRRSTSRGSGAQLADPAVDQQAARPPIIAAGDEPALPRRRSSSASEPRPRCVELSPRIAATMPCGSTIDPAHGRRRSDAHDLLASGTRACARPRPARATSSVMRSAVAAVGHRVARGARRISSLPCRARHGAGYHVERARRRARSGVRRVMTRSRSLAPDQQDDRDREEQRPRRDLGDHGRASCHQPQCVESIQADRRRPRAGR